MVEQRSYNIIFDVARHHRPDQAHMYLFDFGTNGLMPVTDIPHVADYFTVDQRRQDCRRRYVRYMILFLSEKTIKSRRVVNIRAI